jgi:CRP/FNR family transcriptional regulator, anaerobic regulatory protein
MRATSRLAAVPPLPVGEASDRRIVLDPNLTAPSAWCDLTAGDQRCPSGREIVPYRVTAGETCALTTACLMSYDDYAAEALAETEARAITIPRAIFDDLIACSPEFRRFVSTAFSARVTDLFRVIEKVAFLRIDIRLASTLIKLAGGTNHVAATQQQLAAELGSAREVVGRMLAEFHRRGGIATQRGNITITNRSALELARDSLSRYAQTRS